MEIYQVLIRTIPCHHYTTLELLWDCGHNCSSDLWILDTNLDMDMLSLKSESALGPVIEGVLQIETYLYNEAYYI
jgi:hypothetical protein